MASPIRNFGEFFREYDSLASRRPQTGGPLTVGKPPTGGPTPLEPSFDVSDDIRFGPSSFDVSDDTRTIQRPRTPPSPPTPTFDQTTGDEVPRKAPPLTVEPETAPSASVAQSYGAPTQPAPQPTGETPATTPFSSSASSGKASSMYGYKAPQSSQDFWNQIFSPVTGTLESGYGQLGGAVGQFQEQAGDLRSFEDLGGADVLERAVTSGDPAAMEAARAAIGAEYTGPRGLDPETLAALQREFGDIAPYAQNLSSVAGVQALLEQARPGLAGGARRIEAQRLLENPEFRELTRTLGRDIGALGSRTEAEQRAAEDFARQRAESEDEIARMARETLEGRRGSIDEELQQRIDEAQARQRRAAEAYDHFTKTGDASQLQALDLGFDPSMFETELTALDREAQAAREAITSKPEYAEIAGIPLMDLGISKHGKKRYEWDPEWFEANKDELYAKYGKKGVGRLKELARKRQKELTDAGFDIGGRHREAGKFAGVENLYGEDLFDPQMGYEQFVSYDPGTLATRSSVVTGAEQESYNRIQDLLGNAERIQKADPYQAAQIMTDISAWLEQQREQYEAARKQLEDMGYEYESAAKKARKKYKKSTRGVQKALDVLEPLGGKDITGVARGGADFTYEGLR